jgi:hypothetical protein
LLTDAFKQDVDVALPRVAFEEIEDEQSGPFVFPPHLQRAARSSGVVTKVLAVDTGRQ